MRGRKKKFQYITSTGSQQILEIDGDEFAESDYGLVIDNSNNIQELNQKLDTLAQAALQNQTLSFSTIMKLYSSASLAEKQRLIERDERSIQERNAQVQQQQTELQQQQLMQQSQIEEAKMQQQDSLNLRDNETKLQIALINAQNAQSEEIDTEDNKAALEEKIREFDAKLKLDREKLELDRHKVNADIRLKEKQINKQTKTSNK